jgi:hypothetical protein
MAGFNHLIINVTDDGKVKAGKITGIKIINITESSHLFESKKGRFVMIPRNPITKKKAAIIPNTIGIIIKYIWAKDLRSIIKLLFSSVIKYCRTDRLLLHSDQLLK